MAELTAVRLRELLSYDPETGIFRWRNPQGKRRAIAGSPEPRGYVRIAIDRRLYRAHRLAFLYMIGEWPSQIDHCNGNPADNRWVNLRLATRSENAANGCTPRNNLLGLRGVTRAYRKFHARITHKKRRIDLGLYATREEAAAAYRGAARALFGKFAR